MAEESGKMKESLLQNESQELYAPRTNEWMGIVQKLGGLLGIAEADIWMSPSTDWGYKHPGEQVRGSGMSATCTLSESGSGFGQVGIRHVARLRQHWIGFATFWR